MVLRETDPQTTIWELLQPDEAQRLPAELTQVDTLTTIEASGWRSLAWCGQVESYQHLTASI
jgi:hypothetical protein